MSKFYTKALEADATFNLTREKIVHRLVTNRAIILAIYRKYWVKENSNTYATEKFAWALTSGEITVVSMDSAFITLAITHTTRRWNKDPVVTRTDFKIPVEQLSYSVWDLSKLVRADWRLAKSEVSAKALEAATEDFKHFQEAFERAQVRLAELQASRGA